LTLRWRITIISNTGAASSAEPVSKTGVSVLGKAPVFISSKTPPRGVQSAVPVPANTAYG